MNYTFYVLFVFVWHVAQAHDYIHNYTAAHVMSDEEEDLTSPLDWNLLDLMTAPSSLTNMEPLNT